MLAHILTLFLISSLASSDALLSQPLTIRWRYESPVTLNLTPAFDNERIYLPLAGGTIVALKAKDGQLYWRTEVGGELSASPVADEASIFVASETKVQPNETQKPAGALRALGREGGVTQWLTPLVRPLRGALTLSDGKADSDPIASSWTSLGAARVGIDIGWLKIDCAPVVSETGEQRS